MSLKLQDELGLQAPFQDMRHETVLNLVRTATLLSARATQLFRLFDLTEAQFNVLFALKFANGRITQAGLGKRLVVTRASITSVLDKLESKSLVKRMDVPENRRIHHVELTESGQRLVNDVEPLYRKEVQEVLSALADAECQTLIGLTERVRERARERIERNGSKTD